MNIHNQYNTFGPFELRGININNFFSFITLTSYFRAIKFKINLIHKLALFVVVSSYITFTLLLFTKIIVKII